MWWIYAAEVSGFGAREVLAENGHAFRGLHVALSHGIPLVRVIHAKRQMRECTRAAAQALFGFCDCLLSILREEVLSFYTSWNSISQFMLQRQQGVKR